MITSVTVSIFWVSGVAWFAFRIRLMGLSKYHLFFPYSTIISVMQINNMNISRNRHWATELCEELSLGWVYCCGLSLSLGEVFYNTYVQLCHSVVTLFSIWLIINDLWDLSHDPLKPLSSFSNCTPYYANCTPPAKTALIWERYHVEQFSWWIILPCVTDTAIHM